MKTLKEYAEVVQESAKFGPGWKKKDSFSDDSHYVHKDGHEIKVSKPYKAHTQGGSGPSERKTYEHLKTKKAGESEWTNWGECDGKRSQSEGSLSLQ